MKRQLLPIGSSCLIFASRLWEAQIAGALKGQAAVSPLHQETILPATDGDLIRSPPPPERYDIVLGGGGHVMGPASVVMVETSIRLATTVASTVNRGVVVPVPLADTPDDHHNEETEHQGEDQKEQNFESAAEHKRESKSPMPPKPGVVMKIPPFPSC